MTEKIIIAKRIHAFGDIMSDYRIEKDALGEIEVPADAYYGAQTQRAYENFDIGIETLPPSTIVAYAKLKKACAIANQQQGIITDAQMQAIIDACDQIVNEDLAYSHHFPLSVWQSGSGTQTNMNVNEVIAHLGNKKLKRDFLHPNDHVNASQSSNDTFPSVMHISLCNQILRYLLPELHLFEECLEKKVQEFEGIIRIGRTHLQDAVPISLSQSFSAYLQFIQEGFSDIYNSLDRLYELPIGGTAVGTGINTQEGFSDIVVGALAEELDIPFMVSNNKFAALSSHNAICATSAYLSILASNLNKMANDIRLLGSGPRCGLSELILPSNEPGSSIMPGKINPTQCEAMSMVCIQVMQNHQLIMQCNAEGHFELNTYKPLMLRTIIQSSFLIETACRSFRERLLEGLEPNHEVIERNVERSLMLITALKPIIGYEKCAKVALYAHEQGITLKEAGLQLKIFTEELYDQHIKPKDMIHPKETSTK